MSDFTLNEIIEGMIDMDIDSVTRNGSGFVTEVVVTLGGKTITKTFVRDVDNKITSTSTVIEGG